MEEKINQHTRTTLFIWCSLIAISMGLTLFGASKRPKRQIIEKPTIVETKTPEQEAAQEEIEKLAIDVKAKEFDLTDLEKIKVALEHKEQDAFRHGITELISFLEEGNKVAKRLATLPKKEYERVYNVIPRAVGRLTWRWNKPDNWKAIFPLTLWTYTNFPYDSGFTGNKNEIERLHKKACNKLEDFGNEYAFSPIAIENRPQYLEAEGKAMEEMYAWPTAGISYPTPFLEPHYEQLKRRLEKFDIILVSAQKNKDLETFLKVIDLTSPTGLAAEIKAVAHVFSDKDSPLASKAEKRLYNTLDDGAKDVLKLSLFGRGITIPKAYDVTSEFFESVKQHFSEDYQEKIEKMVKKVEDAKEKYSKD